MTEIDIKQLMSDDEKTIWAAMFASEYSRILKAGLKTRADLIIQAATEADCTISTIRRLHKGDNFEGEVITRGFYISRPEDK